MNNIVLYNEARDLTIHLTSETAITIGRGVFECNDHRVSRKHGEITVMQDQISIKACHVNPIFIKKYGGNIQQVLEKGSEIILTNADRFSLLPDDFEYEIKIIREETTEPDLATELRIRGVSEINENLPEAQASSSLVVEPREVEDLDKTQSDISTPPSSPTPNPLNETSLSPNRAGASSPQACRKRGFDDGEIKESCKKPKLSEGTVPIAIKPDPDSTSSALPSTSSTIVSSDLASVANAIKVKVEPSTPEQNVNIQNHGQLSLRPSCEYGVRCYRRTFDHRLELAHPSDADYRRPNFPPAPAGTEQCPFGVQCYRRNPDHFKRLAHPPSSLYSNQPLALVAHDVVQPISHVPAVHSNDNNEVKSEPEEDFDDSDIDQDFVPDEVSDQEDDEEEEETNIET